MAVTHASDVKQAATDAVTAKVSGGTLEILDGAVLLASLALSTPAFGAAASSGLATANTITPDSSANASGVADAWQMKDNGGNVKLSGPAGQKRRITAVSTAADTITMAGDHSAEFAVGTDFRIVGSTGNDGAYTVGAVEYTGGNTVITVDAPKQSIPNATADGWAHVGEVGLDNANIAEGQQVSVTSFTYQALRQ